MKKCDSLLSAFPAEALVRGGGKIKYLSISFFNNISAKNCQHRIMFVKVIARQVVTFLRHSEYRPIIRKT